MNVGCGSIRQICTSVCASTNNFINKTLTHCLIQFIHKQIPRPFAAGHKISCLFFTHVLSSYCSTPCLCVCLPIYLSLCLPLSPPPSLSKSLRLAILVTLNYLSSFICHAISYALCDVLIFYLTCGT